MSVTTAEATPRMHEEGWRHEAVLVRLSEEGDLPSTVSRRVQRTGRREIWTTGHVVADWIESYCVFSDGRWIGKKFRLMPWQRRMLYELFEVDETTGMRLHRWCLVGLPKKNGKSELCAALALFFLHGDNEPAPLVLCAAASDDQANLVFGAASTMTDMSPDLCAASKVYASEITAPANPRSRLVRVAAAAGTNDGKNIHAAVLDELHEWAPGKGEATWNVLTNGLGARAEPMIVQITTAGHDEETVCYRQYALIQGLMDGTAEDDAYYGLWFEAAEDCDWQSEEAVRLCNPSYGVTVSWSFFKDQLGKKTEAVYKRYFLNMWTEAEEVWELAQLWDDLADPEIEMDAALPGYVGVDVGLKHDSTAVTVAQWDPAERECRIFEKIWENPYPPTSSRYSHWRLDIAAVENYVRGLRESLPVSAREDEDENPLPGPAVFYDPFFFERSAQDLRNEGMNVMEFPQTDSRMVPASQRFFELGKSGQLKHRGDPVLRRHVRNVVGKEAQRGWRISKPRGSKKKIDGAVASAIAAYEATRSVDLEDDGSGFNVW